MHNDDWEKYNHEVEDYGFYTLASIERETGANRNKKYDNRIINDLEQELDELKGMVRVLYTLTFTWLIIAIVFIANITLMYAGSPVSNDLAGGGTSVQVTATVEEILGFKQIAEKNTLVSLLAYGNYEKGFIFMNGDTGKILYEFSGIPGNGVVINLLKVNNLVFKPNF